MIMPLTTALKPIQTIRILFFLKEALNGESNLDEEIQHEHGER
jgi:hypothetical protein